ncbi:hypothetical protein [Flavobacterium reichenbachii]|uniref:Uncharacterized protein n=1 Tax=Flavobacterium reichenbachii TaxID=362418 RepID=A0A085ZKD3_9FLAO|nr:hypothetical protein [Flavobacterium reichenbachii]KFF04897.1 hypothetical protein IW19_04855 [Flavobacterium reichenbachii]OXB12119.1 hypothetical protein B0A68_19330 [Flavobacterium reichenbachii]
MQNKETKKKQNIWLLITVGAALILVGFIQFYFYKNVDTVKTEISELVDKYNKNCPLVIQEGIRLDSVNLPETQIAQYNLTLLNVEKETAEVNVIKEEIEKSLISTAKANPGLQVFRENDFILVYSYSDKKKAFLFNVKILPDQYK